MEGMRRLMHEVLTVGGRRIGKGAPCFIIAELGTGFTQGPEHAFRLITAAGQSGADCVKVQIVFADEILHPLAGKVSLPSGRISLFEHFKRCEREVSFYRKLKEYTEAQGLVFLCSVFGTKSLSMAVELGVCMIKTASPELNHFPLLQAIGGTGLPAVLSTGVSTLEDIEKALAVITRNVCILHCITSYPAPENEYNINVIPFLRKRFRIPVGVSDHSLDPELVPVLAAARGAALVEKHFTLQKDGPALDDPIALVPSEFRRMTEHIRQAETLPLTEVLAQMEDRYGKARISAVLGDGRKELAPSEKDNYYTTRRSLLALVPIPKGNRLHEHNTALLRSEKNLRPGLGPQVIPAVYGKTARRFIPAGKGIAWDDLE
ncbi:MAG: N-acetylneuraminate synthase family protein [Spirochaetia bacterium]